MSVQATTSNNFQSIQAGSVSIAEENVILDDYLLRIFEHLERADPKALLQARVVCRQWRRVSEDDSLCKIPKNVNVIGSDVWNTHVDLAALGLDVSDGPTLSKRAIALASRKFLSSVEIERDAGITLLTMPKGLTWIKLVALAKSPKAGNKTDFCYIYSKILDQFGGTSVTQTYVVAISNSVLENSRSLSFENQQALLVNSGCEVPGLLEMATLNIMTYISSPSELPIRLFGDTPWTYSRCKEKVNGNRVVVGGFAPSGLYVIDYYYDHDVIGVAGLRKF